MTEHMPCDISFSLAAYFQKRGLYVLNIKEYLFNHPNASVLVDNADDIGVLMVRSDNSDMYFFDCLRPDLIPQADDVILGHRTIGFSGTDMALSEELKKRYCARLFWENECDMYYYGHTESPEIPQTDINSRLGHIRVADIKTVNDHYTYRHRGTRKGLLDDIRRRSNAAVFVDEKIVSWVLLHPDNSLGVMFTLPEYRGRGYARVLTSALIGEVLKTGNVPYVHIVVGNTASDALAASCGMTFSHRINWLEFETVSSNL